MDALLWVLVGIVLPLALTELSEIAPWLAERIVRFGARLIPDPIESTVREQEWLASLPDVPGKLIKVIDAVSVVAVTIPRAWRRYGIPRSRRHRRLRQAYVHMQVVIDSMPAYWCAVRVDTGSGSALVLSDVHQRFLRVELPQDQFDDWIALFRRSWSVPPNVMLSVFGANVQLSEPTWWPTEGDLYHFYHYGA